jgi:hypothetical protein
VKKPGTNGTEGHGQRPGTSAGKSGKVAVTDPLSKSHVIDKKPAEHADSKGRPKEEHKQEDKVPRPQTAKPGGHSKDREPAESAEALEKKKKEAEE